MFEHILVPLDGSTRAEAALPIAAHIARAIGSSVSLLQVVSIPTNYEYGRGLGQHYEYSGGLGQSYGYGGGLGQSYEYGDGLYSPSVITEEVRETEQTDATAYLTGLANSDLFVGISTSTSVVFGSPAPQILALAEQQAVDLIVLCSHGRTGLSRWVLGSVAQRVIHHSRVPLLVLRDGEVPLPAPHADTAGPLCAVVAVDGSPLAETALLPAAHLVSALAQPTQGILHLLHVVEPYIFGADTAILSRRNVENVEHVQTYLKSVRERLLAQTSDLNLQVTWAVTTAQDVAETLVTTAEKGNESMEGNECALLVMATHGRGGNRTLGHGQCDRACS